jgi:hydrogenase/urease accessory protein HupE
MGEILGFNRDGASIEKWKLDCGEKGLEGYSITISGLEETFTDTLVRINMLNGAVHSEILRGNARSFVVAQSPSALGVMADYFVLGVQHILGGIDHLLFVLCLVILVTGFGNLVKTVTAFTVAHSITLAGSALGYVDVSQGPVEAVIALSILFLARELLVTGQRRSDSGYQPSLTERAPWLVAFAFGLLHGFGFAGALAEIGLPQNEIPLALLMFNVGVEAGQLLFIGGVLLAALGLAKMKWKIPYQVTSAVVFSIGGISAFWLIDRVAGFWV